MLARDLIVLCALLTLGSCRSIKVAETLKSKEFYTMCLEVRHSSYAIPLFKRVFEEEYQVPPSYGHAKIKSIVITDLGDGSAEPAITLGGVGFDFVQVTVTSERGSGLDFIIQIYV